MLIEYSIHWYDETMNESRNGLIIDIDSWQKSKNYFLDPMTFNLWQGHNCLVVWSEKEGKTLSSIRILVANRNPSCWVSTTARDQNHLDVRVSPSGNTAWTIDKGETKIQHTNTQIHKTQTQVQIKTNTNTKLSWCPRLTNWKQCNCDWREFEKQNTKYKTNTSTK